jgi:hypothetical protein
MIQPSPIDPAAPAAHNGVADAHLAALQALADDLEGQPEALLELLRRIEQLHRSIQDGAFRSSLPANRNALFRLLAEMEGSGGWPYIPRLQLRTFMDLLGQGSDSLAA